MGQGVTLISRRQFLDKLRYERNRKPGTKRLMSMEDHRQSGHEIRTKRDGTNVCWTCVVKQRREYAAKNRERMAYYQAKQRCQNPSSTKYVNYGGRGIEFRFTSFEQFIAEVGPRPKGMSLDRIEVNGHYEPGNVRWATLSVQNANQRRWQ
jgi:hypothetical protein